MVKNKLIKKSFKIKITEITTKISKWKKMCLVKTKIYRVQRKKTIVF